MVNLRKFLKPYKDAGALHALLPIRRFVDDQVFLTKRNQLGFVLQVEGVDAECLTEAMLESTTRRMAAAWRSFDDRFRIYQYVVKQNHPGFEQSQDESNPIAAETTRKRLDYLNSKQPGLFSIRLYFVIMLEPGLPGRNAAADLQRNRATLIGHIESLQRSVSDLLGLTVLSKGKAFQFFRLLANLDPDVASAERLKYDTHVDFFLPSLTLSCTEDGLRIGDAETEILTLREPPATTFPNVLRDLIALEANFIACSEYKRALNDKAIATIRGAQNHFHWSQWVRTCPPS